jgi:hypothetical protein
VDSHVDEAATRSQQADRLADEGAESIDVGVRQHGEHQGSDAVAQGVRLARRL